MLTKIWRGRIIKHELKSKIHFMSKKQNKYGNRIKDWAPIEQEWAAGQLSRAEIARKNGCSPNACRKHMAKHGVEYGSLAESVRLKVQSKLVEQPEKVTPQVPCPEPLDAADRAAERGADIVRFHRSDINEQFQLKKISEVKLKSVMESLPNECGVEEIPHVESFIRAHDMLVRTTERLIKLQRQAYSLDDQEKGAEKEITKIQRIIIGGGEDAA